MLDTFVTLAPINLNDSPNGEVLSGHSWNGERGCAIVLYQDYYGPCVRTAQHLPSRQDKVLIGMTRRERQTTWYDIYVCRKDSMQPPPSMLGVRGAAPRE